MIRAPRILELGVALLTARASVRQWNVRAVRTWAFGVALITCLISVGVATAALSSHTTDRPPVRGTSLTPQAPSGTVPGSSSGSQFNAGTQPPRGAAPQTGAPPQTADVQSEPSTGPGHDLSLDIQGLPPARDDPDLEAALSDLDRQADLEQQHGLRQQPVVPTAGPPAALPDGQAPGPPQQATSTIAPAP